MFLFFFIFVHLPLVGFCSSLQCSLLMFPNPPLVLFVQLSQFPYSTMWTLLSRRLMSGTEHSDGLRGTIYRHILACSITDHMQILFRVFWPRRHGNIEMPWCHCSRRIIMHCAILAIEFLTVVFCNLLDLGSWLLDVFHNLVHILIGVPVKAMNQYKLVGSNGGI